MATMSEDEIKGLPSYDAGLLNDYGGGNVEWWQDYIRAELERAHEFYASALSRLLSEREDMVQALKPFAAAVSKYDGDCFWASREASIIVPDEFPVLMPGYEDEQDAARVTVGDFRKASQLLDSASSTESGRGTIASPTSTPRQAGERPRRARTSRLRLR